MMKILCIGQLLLILYIGLALLFGYAHYTLNYEFAIGLRYKVLKTPLLGPTHEDRFIKHEGLTDSIPDLLKYTFRQITLLDANYTNKLDLNDKYFSLRSASVMIGLMRSTNGTVRCGGTRDVNRRILQLFTEDVMGITIGENIGDRAVHSFNIVLHEDKWVVQDSFYGYTLRHRHDLSLMDYEEYIMNVRNQNMSDVVYDLVDPDSLTRINKPVNYTYGKDQKICGLEEHCFGYLPRPTSHLIMPDGDIKSVTDALERIRTLKKHYKHISNQLNYY